MQKGIKVRILIMININDIAQDDLNALKKSDYEAYKSLAQVMLDRILDEIKSEEKNIIQSKNKISDMRETLSLSTSEYLSIGKRIINLSEKDQNALKESFYEAFKSLAKVIFDEIKSEEKNIIQSQNKISNLEKRINNLSEKEQNLPKNQSQQVVENDLREFIPENNLNSSITNPKYAMWYKSNINTTCEHLRRERGLPKDYPLVQRECCYGSEIGAY